MIFNDLQILEKLKEGDPLAYNQLFDKYYMPLCVYSLKYCDSFPLAEDIVQDLFVKIWDEKLYMKFDNPVSPYLFKSVRNNTLQVLKKESKYQFDDIEKMVNNLMEEEPLDFATLEEEKKKLFDQVEALPEKSKEVFKAIVLENMKYKEVAEHLDISVNTVKTHYARALKQLRFKLDIIIMLMMV
ncbi:RNA polymerase sigma-70 factor [Flavobacterium sp.]|uniref:RNA polymerase sigma factor n=1 Tax=Flavobacterium sp. TaxID=239 RepID=UPI00286D9338|nr:RNA polymerase sigma-70 factor [Flavobacterium sp.]